MTRRHETTYAPFLAMVLFFMVLNLGAGLSTLYHVPLKRIYLMAAWHFLTAFAGGMLLALLGSAITGRGKALVDKVIVVLLVVMTLLAVGSNIVAGKMHPGDISHVIMPGIVGITWPLTLLAFFSLTPERLKGVLFFGAFALGDLIWLLLLPAMRIELSSAEMSLTVNSLYKLQAVVQGTLALVCGYAYSRLSHYGQAKSPFDVAPVSVRAAACLFLVLLCMQLLLGAVFGTDFLKISRSTMEFENASYILLASMPLAGLALDRNRRGARLLLLGLGCLVFAAPVAALVSDPALKIHLHGVFAFTRQLFYLSALVLLGRVMGNSRYFPLLCCALYAMLGTSFLGMRLRDALAPVPGGVAGAALVLAVFTAFCLYRLGNFPEIQARHLTSPAAPDGQGAVRNTGQEARQTPELSRVPDFVAAFSLAPREAEVLTGLLQGQSLDLIAERFEITESTVKYHLTRLLRKTQCTNRRSLLTKYKAWMGHT